LAGETLSVDGKTALTESGSATVTSADVGNKTTTYYDVYTGTYDINGTAQFNDNFNSSNNGGLDSNWTVQVGSFTVNSTSQTTTGTDTSDINLATVNSINSVNESVSATISGTLASGQNAGLVALFNSTGRFYYGSIVATSSSTYRASIYSVFGGETPLVEQSYTGSVSNAVLEFTVAGSSLTLLLNGSVVASTTITSASAGVVGILASSGVSFSNFSSSPSLQIQDNTAEVLVSMPGSTSSTNTLLELTANQLEEGGTFTAGTIEIEDLGVNGQPGMLTIPGDLVLDATAGPVTFEDTQDTIDVTGTATITITAEDVADLGNLTTDNGDISLSAGGNISVGTINAGTGTVLITSSSGAVFNSNNGSTTLSITAGLLGLQSSAQSASSAASAAQSASVQAQVNAAQAAATAEAAAAVAAADQTTAFAFQTAMTSMQAAVTIDNQTYQSTQQSANSYNQTITTDQSVVTGETITAAVLDGIANTASLASALFTTAAGAAEASGALDIDIPGLNTISFGTAAGFTIAAGASTYISAIAFLAESAVNDALIAASNQLAIDEGNQATYQAAADQAQTQLLADTDSETAFAAAYNVAEQAYTKALATSNQDEMASQSAQQAAAVAESNAAAASEAAAAAAEEAASASATSSSSSPTLNVTGPVSIGNTQGASGINWTNSITSNSAVTEQTQGPLTISGVTLHSTGSSVTLAGRNVNIASSSTIEANSTITITANASSGATVTVDGTLSAPSATIDADQGNDTITITPSATTPITVTGDSGDALNFNAEGLPVVISGDTITVGTLAPVTFTSIDVVNITNDDGSSLTLEGTSGVANTMSLVGTGQEAGTATLNGVAFSFSALTSFFYEGGASDKIAVTPYANPSLPWNMAVTVSGGTGSPASLTYIPTGPNDTVTATGKDAGSVVEPGMATVLFSNVSQVTIPYQGIQNVELLPNLTVSDASGIYNGKAFNAMVQVNVEASLDGITPTLTYYSGNIVSPADELSGAPINAGTYTVVAAFAGNTTYVNASAVTTFTIAPGTPQVSVNPVKLTYGTALANSQLSGTATFIVNGTKVSVPGIYSYTSAAGTVLAARASVYTEQVTFTPNNTTDFVKQTNLSVMVTVPVLVLAAATAAGPTTEVRVTYSNGTSDTFEPFGGSFTAGATVALGDVTGDGYPDIVVASGNSGYGPGLQRRHPRTDRQLQTAGVVRRRLGCGRRRCGRLGTRRHRCRRPSRGLSAGHRPQRGDRQGDRSVPGLYQEFRRRRPGGRRRHQRRWLRRCGRRTRCWPTWSARRGVQRPEHPDGHGYSAIAGQLHSILVVLYGGGERRCREPHFHQLCGYRGGDAKLR
jgi:hypothetical protein